MNFTFIVVVTGLAILGISLIAVIIWLLLQFLRKKRLKSASSTCGVKKRKAAVSLPPAFELPPKYCTAPVQTDIYQTDRQDFSAEYPSKNICLPNDTENDDSDHDLERESLTSGTRRSYPDIYMTNPRNAQTRRSHPDILPYFWSSESSENGNKMVVHTGHADTKRRRISVDMMQHLKAQGRKASVVAIPPELPEDPMLDTLPVAAAAHVTRKQKDALIKMSDIKTTETDSEDDENRENASTEDVKSTKDDTKKRIAQRRTSTVIACKRAGKLAFSTEYNSTKNMLEIVVHKALDIAKRKAQDTVSPFVVLYLIPGKKQKQQTKIQKKTKEPTFDEKKCFTNLSEEDLHRHRIKLKVYNKDKLTKAELLGETELALSSLKINNKESFCLDLTITGPVQNNGQLMVSLCHQAAFSQLQVIIHKAKNLRKIGFLGTPDPYVSILFCRDNEWEKKITRAKRNTRNPVFNESFNFDVTTDSTLPLNTFSLVLTVTHRSFVSKDEILGHVIFSLESPQFSACEHWRSVTSCPHQKAQAEWHSLLDSEEL